MGVMLDWIGQLLAGYLQKEVPGYEPFTPSDPEHLRGVVESVPGRRRSGVDRGFPHCPSHVVPAALRPREAERSWLRSRRS